MARKQIHWTEEKINRFIKEGRGQGEGKDYKPWLQIGDFSSQGRGHRIFNYKTGRMHHFFSDLEANYYYLLAWSDAILDIREQFPLLPRSETEQIADELGYRHPHSIGASVNLVMTTDVLITVEKDGATHFEARYVKYSKDFANQRTCEKREIEEQYWRKRDVPFRVVTEQSINMTRVRNIKQLLGRYEEPQFEEVSPQTMMELKAYMIELVQSKRYDTLDKICARLEQAFGLKHGTGLHLFYHMAAHKLVPLKLDSYLLLGTSTLNNIVDWNSFEKIIVEKGKDLDEYLA